MYNLRCGLLYMHNSRLLFLYQACAGHRPEHAWFLKTVSVWMSVCVCICVYVCMCLCVCLCLYVSVCVCPKAVNN